MVAPMTKRLALLLAMLATATTAHAGASNFTRVNATGTPLADLSIRRAGTEEWKPLAPAPAPGAGAPIKFDNPDCAFDIRAKVAGKDAVTWAGVNLCDVKSVVLKRDEAAGAWVDYDQ
jgi:hypothetical protein